MAGTHGNQDTDLDLVARLAKDPYSFGFYAALRELECLYNTKPRFGYSSRPVDDPIRLGQAPSLQFAPSTLSSFKSTASTHQLKVLFFGLFGPNGPLPLHLTEYTRNRIRDAKDSTLVDFADMFHHRLLCLFYRAWADKEPTVHLDRPEKDRFSDYVGSLLGIGMPSLQHRDSIPDHTKLHFAAHLGCHTKHCEGLISILKDFFRVPVKIQEFIGEWLAIPKNSYCYLDSDQSTGQLGVSAIIGTNSWQCQHKFRLTMGPLSLSEYEDFLPTGKRLKNVLGLVNNYIGFELNWDLNLMLKKNEVPATQLSKYGQLGWTTWLQTPNKRQDDANDLYLAREKIV
jgi:type VI secretion system protein ImpH